MCLVSTIAPIFIAIAHLHVDPNITAFSNERFSVCCGTLSNNSCGTQYFIGYQQKYIIAKVDLGMFYLYVCCIYTKYAYSLKRFLNRFLNALVLKGCIMTLLYIPLRQVASGVVHDFRSP